MSRGPYRGYFPDPAKLLFIAENPEDEEATRWDFDQVVLNFNYAGGR